MLKRNVFILSFIIFLIYGAVVLHLQTASISSLTNYEVRENALHSLRTALGIVDNETKALQRNVSDYANWDDLYEYTKTKSPNFITSNFYDEALKNLHVNYVAIYSVSGDLLYNKVVDLPSSKVTASKLFKSAGIQPTNYVSKVESGFFKVNNQLYMFSAQPIRDSFQKKASRGVLIFARPAEGYITKSLAPWFQYPPEFVCNVNQSPQNATALSTWFSSTITPSKMYQQYSKDIVMDLSKKSTIELYYRLKNFKGQDICFLKVRQSTQLVAEGRKINFLMAGLTLITGLLVAILFSLMFNRTFIRPLENLKHHMMSFKHSPNTEPPDDLTHCLLRKDEVGDLTRKFIEMQSSVTEAYRFMDNANHILEEKVLSRTDELKTVNKELLLSDTIIRSSTEGVLICDSETTIIRVNDAFCQMSGFDREDLIGQTPRLLKSNRHGNDFYKAMWQKIIATGNWSGEIWDRKKNGEVYPKWISISSICDDNGVVTHYTSISSDISSIKATEAQLKTLAFYDSLTGLPNRALFYDRLSQAIKNVDRYKTKFAVFFMDLDGFKNVNDTYGHNIGDELLVLVGKRLMDRVRKSDTVARLGGDEFTIILHPIAWKLNLSSIAEKIIKAVEEPYFIGDIEIQIGISIGIAIVPDDSDNIEEIVKKADSAMYLSKNSGRGCYSFASDESRKSHVYLLKDR